MKDQDPWLATPEACAAAGPARVGGKAAALARLAGYGFPVPAFVVLPVTHAPGPPSRAVLAAAWRSLGNGPLAVRSSAPAEDSRVASFAGVLDSVLEVADLETLERAVQQVRASAGSERAREYRARMGLPADTDCAVILQRLVGARVAGVAFTADPETGRRDLVRLEAVPGLGEALVSGRRTPETRTVAVTPDGLVLAPASPDPPGAALPAALALRVGRMARRVQWALGEGREPQDVEWAWDGEVLWVLQARPVTAAREVVPPGFPRRPHLWSNANIGDVLPHVTSDLTWSCLLISLQEMFPAPFLAAGYHPPAGMELTRRIRGRGYFELGFTQWMMYDAMGMTPAEVNHSLGGHQPEIQVPPRPMAGRAGLRRLLGRLRLLGTMAGLPARRVEWTQRLEPWLREVRGRDLHALTRPGMAEFVREMRRVSRGFYPFTNLANALAGAWQDALRGACEAVAPGQGTGLASRLLAGRGQVPSAEAGYRLHDLAALARPDAAVLAWLEPAAREPAASQTPPPPGPFASAWAAYLEDFGHRAGNECEVAHPRWREDPRELLASVRALATAPPGTSPREAARRLRLEAEAELARASRWRAPLIRWLAARAHAASVAREQAKSLMVGLAETWRRLSLVVGARLVQAGHLAGVDEVFHLSYEDLDAWFLGEWEGDGAAARAADGRARLEAWGHDPAPPVVEEDQPLAAAGPAAPAFAGAAAPGDAAGPGDPWRGVAAAAGRATGRVRVLRHPGDGRDFAAGEILVAPSTDPGWTPLLIRAGAVVTEVGGYLSHGAIVARELGVPAVVNLPGVLTRLAEGDWVEVDGDTGTVRRVQRP